MRANYHTHTPRCNHAEGEEWQYVERALEAGFVELGFSDHTPYFFDKPGYYSSFRMRPEQLEDYVSTILSLREEYRERILLYLGLEAEYYPKLFPKLLRTSPPREITFLRRFCTTVRSTSVPTCGFASQRMLSSAPNATNCRKIQD